MGIRQQLTEPWGIVAAGLLGGVGAAVTGALSPAGLLAGVPVGLGVAGLVYGVRVGLGALVDRGGRGVVVSDVDPPLPSPPRGSEAERWLRRAERAVGTLRRQTESPWDAALRARVSDVDDQAAGVLADLRRFAGQVTLLEQTLSMIPVDRLRRDQGAIERELRSLPAGPVREERQRALGAVADQLAVAGRLGEARETLLARLQSAALGLEGLVTRLAELLALHATMGGGSPATTRLAELTGDLEGMRAGLAEAERVSRSALGEAQLG